MSDFSPQTEKLLAFSVEQYRELLQHGQELSQMLSDCSYSRIHEHAARLQELQAAAGQQDELLLPFLRLEFPAWERHPLYITRLGLISSILKLNEELLPKIRSMMAVASTEIAQLQMGRVALNGYAFPRTAATNLRIVG